MSDNLFELRTFFCLGNYGTAIHEGSKGRPKDEKSKLERDVLLHRCYIEQGNAQVVLDEVKGSVPLALQATRLLAQYSKAESKESILSSVKQMLQDPSWDGDELASLVLATILFSENFLEEALRLVFSNNRLDARALVVQILLKLNRPDLAEKEVAAMQKMNEFAAPTQLATAWTNVALGGDRIREAVSIYQDLMSKYGPSPLLLNNLAVAFMNQKKYQDAEAPLLQAIERNSKLPEVLVNLIAVSQMLNKPADTVNRYIAQLKSVAPSHPWLVEYNKKDESFDSLASKFAR